MTIAIAAISNPDDVIVCVSDRMVSFGDAFPAEDNATVKAIYLHEQWTGAWSTNRLPMILPIIQGTRNRLAAKDGINEKWNAQDAAEEMAAAYSEHFQKEFVATHLSRYGYKTIHEFRQQGRSDIGEHFIELARKLDLYDLHTSFLLFGHDNQKHGKIFEIECPGHVIDQNALKYAVIGSGHDMAMASLRWPPPLTFLLEDTIYRLLEAKFSAETATGVGKATTVALRNRDGFVDLFTRTEIEELNKIWRRDIADIPSPPAAIELLKKSHAVRKAAGNR